MGKTIELNMSFDDLRDDRIRIADEDNIISHSEDESDLSAIFSKSDLTALLNQSENSDGIRIYPAVNNNQLIMLAFATRGINDIIGDDRYCLARNAEGPVPVNGSEEVGQIQMVPTDIALHLINGVGSGREILDQLDNIRQKHLSTHGLKVIFDRNFIIDNVYDDVIFEVVDLKLKDHDEEKRTITANFRKNTSSEHDLSIYERISMLPCPPNCGGVYLV